MSKFPITFRKNHAQYHNSLDPLADRVEIMETLITREFPVEILLAAEIAQLRSFTIPNGTKLLHRTAEFEKNSLKRLDDTRAILVEMGKNGFNSPEAQEMADHLNQIHGFYNIPNDEFLYTLSTFIYDLWLFVEKYGWRKFTEVEKQAIYYTYQEMGQLMNIKDIPESFEAFWEWRQQYERENQAFAEENYLVSEGLFNGAKQMVPWLLQPLVKPFVFTLENDRFAQLLGYKRPNALVRAPFQLFMWLRKQGNKLFTLWDVWDFRAMLLGNFQTYPNGYKKFALGPEKLVKQIKKRGQQKEATLQHTP